jgi:biopolymer transport protein ExbD
MNFRRRRSDRDELDINFIPLIDVLLVMLIFLAATTSFARFSQLEVALPEANVDIETPSDITIDIGRDGRLALNDIVIDAPSTADIADFLSQAASGKATPTLLIHADAQATHQSVVNVMEAARQAGVSRVNFAAQNAR